jgi:hypothetical protein
VGASLENKITKADRKYIDFIISDQSLSQLLRLSNMDLIGTFGWSENTEYENKKVDEFLGKQTPELETGRTCFYVCPECGDIGCGAITAKIELTDKNVIWKDFGYENDYSDSNFEKYKGIGPFIFDKKEYYKTIEQLKI